MTREEAIEKLKELLECNYVDRFEDEENEAPRMAIKVMEQDSLDVEAAKLQKAYISPLLVFFIPLFCSDS